MNPEELLNRLKSLGAAFTRTQLITLALAFASVVGIVGGSAWYLSRPTYALLYSDMDPEAAAQIIAKLDAQKVEYRIDPGGRGIRVPDSQIDRLRLELSAEGLPSSGRIGFEIFDRTAFGATEFLEHVNYRRALEGEIARTISTLSEVAGARVHIAMAKESIFGQREQPAKASVILKLRSQRPLSSATIVGITNLVAASVEGLRPESVVIMDSFGRPLARPPATDDGEPLGTAEMERQQRVEHDLSTRLVSLLEPVAGENRVRVNVAARLSADSEERTEERWDPASPVIRSRQQTSDVAPSSVNGGLSGARANLPAPAPASGDPAAAGTAAPAAPPAGMAARSSETVNYEISRTTRHTVRPRGDVARLSVAVVLDDELVVKKEGDRTTRSTRPRSPAEMQKIQALVAAAAGIDTTRGDQLTVENIAFDVPVVDELAAPGFFERYGEQVHDGARYLTVLAVAGLLAFFVIRPLLSSRPQQVKAKAVAAAPGSQLPASTEVALPRTVQELEGEIEAQLEAEVQAKTLENLRVPVLRRKAHSMIQSEPEQAARLMRTWLSEEEA